MPTSSSSSQIALFACVLLAGGAWLVLNDSGGNSRRAVTSIAMPDDDTLPSVAELPDTGNDEPAPMFGLSGLSSQIIGKWWFSLLPCTAPPTFEFLPGGILSGGQGAGGPTAKWHEEEGRIVITTTHRNGRMLPSPIVESATVNASADGSVTFSVNGHASINLKRC